jgi:hypothetical protein
LLIYRRGTTKMLKKVVILAAALTLLLAIAQIALAQQDPDQVQPTDDTQTTGGEEPSASQPSSSDQGQQNASQPPSSEEAPQAAQANLNGLMHLNKKNELIVDCAAVTGQLTQLQGTPVESKNDKAMLVQVADLSLLCNASGFTPASSAKVPDAADQNGTASTQPQQDEGTETAS